MMSAVKPVIQRDDITVYGPLFNLLNTGSVLLCSTLVEVMSRLYAIFQLRQ